MGFFSWLFKRKKKQKKITLGLALGSGGAKGFAEIGALAAFEENGITFDYIAGSSIGSIVGAFYADGYSSTDIAELLKSAPVSEIKNSFMMMNMDTDGLYRVLDRFIGHKTFDELKKPFKAVATEYSEGQAAVLSDGSVAAALCASSSYTPVFKPVTIDGKLYVDGAFSNSVPADVVKEMGADIIVGIDLSSHSKKVGFWSSILPSYPARTQTPWDKGYEFSDVMIHPDLSEYKPTSFNSGAEMYRLGYIAATEAIPKIRELQEKLKHPEKVIKKNKRAGNK